MESQRQKDWKRDRADLQRVRDDKRGSKSPNTRSDRESGVSKGMFRKPGDDQGYVKFFRNGNS